VQGEAATVTARPYRPGRYRRQRNGNAEKIAGLAVGLALAVAAGTHAAADHHVARASTTDAAAEAAPPAIHPAPVTSESKMAFIAAVLADLDAPDTSADQRSMAAWGAREGCWGCVGVNNQWDTTLAMPGSWDFNTFDGDLHVQGYPTASEGAQATALTLEGGYPLITAALRSGAGICGHGFASEFARWSGDGYQEVC
jgi:hypothetical protein